MSMEIRARLSNEEASGIGASFDASGSDDGGTGTLEVMGHGKQWGVKGIKSNGNDLRPGFPDADPMPVTSEDIARSIAGRHDGCSPVSREIYVGDWNIEL